MLETEFTRTEGAHRATWLESVTTPRPAALVALWLVLGKLLTAWTAIFLFLTHISSSRKVVKDSSDQECSQPCTTSGRRIRLPSILLILIELQFSCANAILAGWYDPPLFLGMMWSSVTLLTVLGPCILSGVNSRPHSLHTWPSLSRRSLTRKRFLFTLDLVLILFLLAEGVGFEPTLHGSKPWVLNHWTTPLC